MFEKGIQNYDKNHMEWLKVTGGLQAKPGAKEAIWH